MMGSLWSGGHTSNVTQHQRLTPDKNSLTSEKCHHCFPLLLRKSFYRPRVYNSSSSSPLSSLREMAVANHCLEAKVTSCYQRAAHSTPPKRDPGTCLFFCTKMKEKNSFLCFAPNPPKKRPFSTHPLKKPSQIQGAPMQSLSVIQSHQKLCPVCSSSSSQRYLTSSYITSGRIAELPALTN